ncbi:MAG: hypothetical protein WC208_10375 [Gallionella sp.]
MKTLISFDFDFFVRENPLWDWGHSENKAMFLTLLWGIRYSDKKLYEECDPAKYADFMPEDTLLKLIKMGFTFKKKPLLYVSESHKDIYEVARGLERSEIYHFDAHHDLYDDGGDLNCGNWGIKAIEQGLVEKYIWVAPEWGKEYDMMDLSDYCLTDEIQGHYYNDFLKIREKAKPIDIDAIFICRSGAWVPPHLDEHFFKMARGMSCFSGKAEIIGQLIDRKGYVPTKEEAAKQYKKQQKIYKGLKTSWAKTQSQKVSAKEVA